jgi:hypothetical protein
MKPSAAAILNVLADGREHSALEFFRGDHGFRVSAVSQRVGEIRRAGYDVASTGAGGHELARYRLTTVPTLDTFDGALFEVEEARPHTAA